MMRRLLTTLSLAALLLPAGMSGAPVIHPYKLNGGVVARKLSDNGRWLLIDGWKGADGTPVNGSYLVDLDTDTPVLLTGSAVSYCGARDASDDGTVVGFAGFGSYESPAYRTTDGVWHKLPYPSGWHGAVANAVSADGRYAVGAANDAELMNQAPLLWDLTTGSLVDLEGLPRLNRLGEDIRQLAFTDISPDGSVIIGRADWSYIDGALGEEGFQFVYWPATGQWRPIGYNLIDGIPRFSLFSDMSIGFEVAASPDCSHALVSGVDLETGATRPIVYDIASDSYTTFPLSGAEDVVCSAVTNQGVPIVGSPSDIPIRDWSIFFDGYWVSGNEIYRELFGRDIEQLTGIADAVSGTVMSIDNDASRFLCMIYENGGESYMADFGANPLTLISDIDLLAEYSVKPAEGSRFSYIKDLSVAFNRDIEVCCDANGVSLLDARGNVVANSIKVAVNPVMGSTLDIAFRMRELADGQTYTVVIPAGAIATKGDHPRLSRQIEIGYTGREVAPVTPVAILPSPDTKPALFNSVSNPVSITFDTEVMVSSEASGSLMLLDADGSQLRKVTDLAFYADGRRALVYPLTGQKLFDGETYALCIAPGSFTDIIGQNPSEYIEVVYEGSYREEVDLTNPVLFSCDFNTADWASKFLWLEGDYNQPNAEMQSYGFLDNSSYPWWWVFDEGADDNPALMSHSMYSPPGQSDDWAVIPSLYIRDKSVQLSFKGQGFRKGMDDRLAIYVLATDDHYFEADFDFAARVRAEGDRIFDEVLDPGSSEETLAGDWKDYELPLGSYAGRNVYICFVNENDNRSGIFIDDVVVSSNPDLLLTLTTPSLLVQADETVVEGSVKLSAEAQGEVETITLTLTDKGGTELDRITIDDMAARDNGLATFRFAAPLPLTRGVTNVYRVTAEGGGYVSSAEGRIDNLLFEPEKRLLMEIGTGQGCSACPLGHIALDRLTDAYGDRIAPVAWHTYDGDNLHSGMTTYVRDFLGIGAYPCAVIDRRTSAFPMQSDNNEYVISNGELWWDYASLYLSQPATADIAYADEQGDRSPVYTEDGWIYIPVAVTTALDIDNFNAYLIHFVTEDGLEGFQNNGFYNATSPMLGEWGKGGIYGKALTPFTFDHVGRGIIGSSYIGDPGLFPSRMEAGVRSFAEVKNAIPAAVENPEKCRVVSVLIDGNTGAAVNCISAPLARSTSVGELAQPQPPSVTILGHSLTVEAQGPLRADIYALDGSILRSCQGRDAISFTDLPSGMAILVVTSDQGSYTRKLIF